MMIAYAALHMVVPAPAIAQADSLLRAGARVRIVLVRPITGLDPLVNQYVGTLSSIDTLGLTAVLPDSSRYMFPADAVAQLFVSNGTGRCDGQERARCVIVSTVFGLVAGHVIGRRLVAQPECSFATDTCVVRPRIRLATTVLGGLMGLGVGFAVFKDRWEEVRPW